MDLLFQRYASPFLLLDGLLTTSSLTSFITDMYEQVNEEKLWNFYLHKVFDQTWGEFLDDVKPKKVEKIDVGETIIKSKQMLNNFTPK